MDGENTQIHFDSVDMSVLAELRTLSTDPKRINDLISLFLDGLAKDLASMKAASLTGDKMRLKEIAHGCKGASANMGALRLAEACFAIEKACDTESPDSLNARLTVLESESFRVTTIMAGELAR